MLMGVKASKSCRKFVWEVEGREFAVYATGGGLTTSDGTKIARASGLINVSIPYDQHGIDGSKPGTRTIAVGTASEMSRVVRDMGGKFDVKTVYLSKRKRQAFRVTDNRYGVTLLIICSNNAVEIGGVLKSATAEVQCWKRDASLPIGRQMVYVNPVSTTYDAPEDPWTLQALNAVR